MKIKIKSSRYSDVMNLPKKPHQKPMRQSFFFRLLLRIVSIPELIATGFSVKKIGMERLGKREPCLFLMNHASFLDLEMASVLLFPRRYNIVCTEDGFIGKKLLMRLLGCIPTKKFVFDLSLVKDLQYAVTKLKSSVLLFPEAGYSFDGRTTVLPDNLGSFIKHLNVPVVMIESFGSFARQPLYNNLHRRKIKTSAEMRFLFSADELQALTAEEIQTRIIKEFSFDAFRWQQENQIKIDFPKRAEGLQRLLYKCPACLCEDSMKGEGDTLTCHACGKQYRLTELGALEAIGGQTEFAHIPDWFDWQRACVCKELEQDAYVFDSEVDIMMQVDHTCLYRVGEGHLHHDKNGFYLSGCNGELEYHQKPIATYCLNADFYWYEISDMIGIGNQNALYFCFPKSGTAPVAKMRFATEELYKTVKRERDARAAERRQKREQKEDNTAG